ncbi:MAG: MBOAT family O-acyltransferase [Phycisphaerae bacterium]
MLFQTPEFLVLMLAVMASIILIRTHYMQMIVLLAASWVFYAWWKPIFLLLLLYSTVTDYFVGLAMHHSKTQRARNLWLVVSCITNLGVLGFFKYCDFFIDSFNSLAQMTGGHALLPLLHITLPVGVSFYTFQSMSYTIDVYRRELPAERSFIRFALFVAFFPQLVAGPILRAQQFIPQLYQIVSLEGPLIRSGLNLFLVGLIKKVVVADNVSPLADLIFKQPQGLPSPLILLGALAFGVQIYCDFSGYTDMARGAGRMLGYDILRNFNFPYFARSITDFWRRWHMSLSTWLRDYLYVPLGGNRHGTLMTYRNLMLTMTLGGLWHGAGWNFVVWGFYQGALLAIERTLGIGAAAKPPHSVAAQTASGEWAERQRLTPAPRPPLAFRVTGWIVCQYFVFLGWVLFRVHNAPDLAYCVRKYVLFDFNFRLAGLGLGNVNPFYVAIVLLGFISLHAISHRIGSIADWLDRQPGIRACAVYTAAAFVLSWCWPQAEMAFIYFQF